MERAIGSALVHVRQVFLHRFCREEGHFRDAQWLEDVLLHVVTEFLTGGALHKDPDPVHVDLVFVSMGCSFVPLSTLA